MKGKLKVVPLQTVASGLICLGARWFMRRREQRLDEVRMFSEWRKSVAMVSWKVGQLDATYLRRPQRGRMAGEVLPASRRVTR